MELTDNIDRLVQAVRDKGVNPYWHDRKLYEFSQNMPVLYGAVMVLVQTRELENRLGHSELHTQQEEEQ